MSALTRAQGWHAGERPTDEQVAVQKRLRAIHRFGDGCKYWLQDYVATEPPRDVNERHGCGPSTGTLDLSPDEWRSA